MSWFKRTPPAWSELDPMTRRDWWIVTACAFGPALLLGALVILSIAGLGAGWVGGLVR